MSCAFAETIFLTGNDIYGEIPTSIGRMTNLKRFQVSENKLDGTLPSTMRYLKELQILSASNNQLSGSLDTELGLLTRLTFLSLSSNSITGTIPSELGNLQLLNFLSLQSNLLTGTIPDELRFVDGLATLWLSDNDLYGAVPTGICDATTTSAVALDLTIDCDQVTCSCCSECDGIIPPTNGEEDIPVVDDTTTTTTENTDTTSAPLEIPADVPDEETAAPVVQLTEAPSDNVLDGISIENITASVPYPVDINMETPTPPDYTCYNVQVGFGCYLSGWSIDFETVMCNQRDFNLVAVFPYPNVTTATSFVGGQVSMDDALYWSTNCEELECDGAISGGRIFYRNQFPTLTSDDSMVWPFLVGEYLVRIVQADESGIATILAESSSFKVADQCE
jgi:hypothetical protein